MLLDEVEKELELLDEVEDVELGLLDEVEEELVLLDEEYVVVELVVLDEEDLVVELELLDRVDIEEELVLDKVEVEELVLDEVAVEGRDELEGKREKTFSMAEQNRCNLLRFSIVTMPIEREKKDGEVTKGLRVGFFCSKKSRQTTKKF